MNEIYSRLRRDLLHVDSLALTVTGTLHERSLHVDSLALTVSVTNVELPRLHVIHHSYQVRGPQYYLTVLQPVGEGNKPPHGRATGDFRPNARPLQAFRRTDQHLPQSTNPSSYREAEVHRARTPAPNHTQPGPASRREAGPTSLRAPRVARTPSPRSALRASLGRFKRSRASSGSVWQEACVAHAARAGIAARGRPHLAPHSARRSDAPSAHHLAPRSARRSERTAPRALRARGAVRARRQCRWRAHALAGGKGAKVPRRRVFTLAKNSREVCFA